MRQLFTGALLALLLLPLHAQEWEDLSTPEWSEEWGQSSLPPAGLTTDDFPLPPNLEVVPPEEVVIPYLVVTGSVSSTEEFREVSQVLYEAMSQELEWQSSIYDFYTVIRSGDPLPDIPSQELLKPEYVPARYVITGTVSRDQYDDGSTDMDWVNYTLTAWIPGNGNATRSVQVSSAFVEPTEILDFIPFLVWQLTSVFPVNTAPLPKLQPPDALPLPEDFAWKHKWLYLDFQAGGSGRLYANVANNTRNLAMAFDIALHLDFQFLSFYWPGHYLSFSALSGAALNMDKAVYRDYTFANVASPLVESTVEFTSYSLAIPLYVKINLKPNNLALGLYGGIYYNLPLVSDVSFTSPLGYTAGISAGTHLGPGTLSVDVHYSADLGDLIFPGNPGLHCNRSFFAIAVGYSFGLINKAAPTPLRSTNFLVKFTDFFSRKK